MSVKTAGVGHFQIPTAPAAGTSCTSGAANVYTTNAVQLIASTAAALYITGLYAEEAAVSAPTYKSVQLMIGAGGAETNLGQYLISPSTGSTVTRTYRAIFPPIPVAISQRISVKTADSVGALATLISIECIAQSNVVDDGIAITTVTTVTNQLTAAAIATGVWQDATAGDFTTASSIGKALYIANVAPGGSGGLMISGTNAGTTTLGALTITGATTHTGNVVFSDGVTISAPSTGNRAGLSITGNGTGAGAIITGGATGIGFNLVGGGTSGDGIKVTTTSGHGLNLAPVGTNMHGFLSTGGNGGTSDGIKAAAGTGGVDFRANQTGNLTGTVATLTTYTGNTPQTGDAFARLGAPAGASVSADIVAINAKTTNLPAAPASTTNITAGTITTVTTLTNLPTIPANWITAAGITAAALNGKGDWMVSYTQPTGFLAATFPAGTVANTTNITAGTMTTTTNLTNAPTAGDFTATMKTSLSAATPAVTVSDKTGFSLVAGYDPAKTASQAGDAMTLTAAYDAAKTAAPASDVTAIKAKTDGLNFTSAGYLDINVLKVNGITIKGSGTAADPWGPV